jgi:integrase
VWRIKYRDATGAQVMETVGAERDGVTEKLARQALEDKLSDVRRKEYRRPKATTFEDYARSWFAEGAARRRWKTSTVRQYVSVEARLVQAFGRYPLGAIRPRHIAEYVAERSADLGAATVSRDVSLLHAIFDSAIREELAETNPATRVERPKLPRQRWRILEPAEVARVAQAFTDDQARAVFLTLVLTGLRRAELQALRWRDVDLLEGVLRVRDSKTEDGIRSIAVPATLSAVLREQYQRSAFKGNDELVFCQAERGTVYRAERYKEAFEAALAAAGIEGRVRAFHDLRHTAITNDAATGSSAIAVMTKAGHADMRTTQRYLHLAGVVFRDEAERLERRLLGVEGSTRLSEPQITEDAPTARSQAE